MGSVWKSLIQGSMPKNPSPPFSGRSQELPACLHASAHSSCPKDLPKNCTLCLKSSHIQNKMKLHQQFPSREEKLHIPPCLSQQNKGSFLFFAVHLRLQNGGKKGCLSFPGRLAYSNTWIFAISRRGFADTRRRELYLRHATL